MLFAFSTAITWCYYGDRSTAYIFGEKAVFWYRNFYVLCFILAAVIDTTIVWNIAYVSVALVSIPNLVALFFLRKEVFEIKKIEVPKNIVLTIDSLPEQINWIHVISGRFFYYNKMISNV